MVTFALGKNRCPAIGRIDVEPEALSLSGGGKLFEWVEREEAEGAGEAPYPPNFPKMPGEPPRVQPSKKVDSHWDEHGNRIVD